MKIIKSIKIFIIIFLILFSSYFIFTYIKKQNEAKKIGKFNQLILKKAKKYTVSKNSIPDYIEIDDEVEPEEIRNLSFPISGKIDKIFINEGDYVKKDKIIAKLDTSNIELSMMQTEKNLENAIATGSSKLDIDIFKKQKEIFITQLNDSYLKAPFSGYISEVYKNSNDVVSAGQTICQIYNIANLISKVWIDETEINKIKTGNIVEVTFSYNEKKKYYGKVVKIYNKYQIVDGVVSYPVEIQFKNLPEDIKPGFTFSGKIFYGKKNNKIVVPVSSVNKDNKGYYVAKIENNKIVKTYIKIGDITEKYYVVNEGLKEGDIILFLNILGYKTLKDNKAKTKFNPLRKKPPIGK